MNPAQTLAAQTLAIASRQSQVSPEEWQTRVDLAACYRLVAQFGWSDLVFTHISARVPGSSGEFLINPYGLMFDEITASSLVKVDVAGNKLDDSPFPVNPAGFTIHSAIHSARHDAQCVLHTHSLNGVAVSAQEAGLLPLSQHSIFVLSSIGYHDYEGVALNEDEKPRLVADMGRANHLVLRNHGLLTAGPSIADAFLAMYMFEAACTIQVRAQSGGGPLLRISQAIIDGAHKQAKQVTNSVGAGRLAWPGLLRRLDRTDPSYRK
ncbi:MAG: class aldolase/adducin family protein [Paucimonas sp.]|nr:class aldolase/adducin family protein [Paucimonas sp.]